MENYKVEKKGIHGIMLFGAKNPEVNTPLYLKQAGLKYTHENNGNFDRFLLPYCNGDLYVVDVIGFLADRFALEGVVGYGVGKKPEEVETVLNHIMKVSGSVPLRSEMVEGSEFFGVASKHLDELVENISKDDQ